MSYNNSDVRVGGRGDLIASYSTYKTKVLPNNLVDHRNVLTQLMMNTPNTKYVIKWDYVLNESITLPAGCLIEFDGGSIRNDNGNEFTLTGNDTIVIFYQDRDKIVKDVELLGNFIFNGSIDTADEEDITGKTGVLKFADKDYDPENFSGLGRVYLRKNIGAPVDPDNNIWCYKPSTDEFVYLMYRYQGVYYHIYDEGTGKGLVLHNNIVKETDEYNVANLPEPAQEHNMPYIKNGDRLEVTLPDNTVVDDSQINNTEIFYYVDEEGDESQYAGKNILTQDMINKPNTIYIIQYDYVLGEDITVPANCVLEFDGGSLKNGTIVGNETKLQNLKKSLSNILIEGDFVCDESINEYSLNRFGYNSDTDFINNLLKIKTHSIHFLKSDTYNLEINNYYSILFHTGNNVDFNNSIFVLKPNSFTNYVIFQIANVKDVIISNFSIKGDVATHLSDGGEWGHGIHISNCSENIVIKNAQIDECWGDGIDIIEYELATEPVIGPPINVIIDNVKCYKNRRQGLSIEAGKHIKVTNSEFRYTGNIKGTAPAAGIDIEPFSYHDLYYVEDIVIDNCIITDNCQNISVEPKADFKILANTSTPTIYFGYNNVKVTNCTCDYTEVKDSYGVYIDSSKFNSIVFYNGDDLKFSNNNVGLLYIQNWKNVDICNNIINSVDTPQFGWRRDTTVTIMNIEGVFENNNVFSYVPNVFYVLGELIVQNNSFIQLFTGESSVEFEAIIHTVSATTQLLVTSNYFKLNKPLRINKANDSTNNIPVVNKNVFLNSVIIDVKIHADDIEDLIFAYNYIIKGENISFWSATGSIIAYGNNFKSTDARIKSMNDPFIVTDNEIKRFIVGDSAGTLYPIALVQAIRNANAFYSSKLSGKNSVVNIGYANDIEIPVIWNGTSWVGYDGKALESRYGSTENRPTIDSTINNFGFPYYDTNLNKTIYWNGSEWTNSEGIDIDVKYSGTFEQKPLSSKIPIGFAYFCTDKQTTEGAANGITIYHKGSDVWVDALGRVVS